MKKIKLNKTNKISLLWYSHPRVAVALMLLAINLFVIFLFTLALALVSGNGFFDELAYLFTYTMCSDGIYDFVNNQEDLACFIIKIILTVIQMVVFSGALIGFTTDVIQNMFDNRLENKGTMYLKDHFVFLNWSAIGQHIIYDLSFLEGEKTVVILTDEDREEVINSIDNIFVSAGRKRKNLRIFVKKGDPTSSKMLSEISIAQAKHIGILLPDQEDRYENVMSTKDLIVFKLMLLMIEESAEANIVVETESEIAKQKMEQLIESTYEKEKHRIAVFSHNALMGHVLGRSTTNSLFAPFVHDILSFDGSEIYGIEVMDVEEALYTYNDCIPLVNYDDDGNEIVDQLYVLSDNEQSLGRREEMKSYVKYLEYKEDIKTEPFTLFVFADSDKAHFAMTELKSTNQTYGADIKYELFSYTDDIETVIQTIKNTEGKKKVLLLSDENGTEKEQDAAVFMLLLNLKTSHVVTKDVEIFVELVNIDNLVPVRNLGIASVILTNKIISLYMLQLLTHKQSRRFFKDVLLTNGDSGEIDFEIIPADQLLVFHEESMEFSCSSEIVQSFYVASEKRKMLVGYFPEGKDVLHFFCNKMDEEEKIVIRPKDNLIVLAYK